MAVFAYFSRFQADLAKPFQNAWFYLDSNDFTWSWSESLFLLTFWGFRLISQNPCRIHDFTWILVILCDFVAECSRWLFFAITFPGFNLTSQNPIQNAWFSCHLQLFLAISYYFLPFPAMSCCFLQFPATAASCYFLLCLVISYDSLLFPASFEHFLLCHARSCYFILFLLISCNFLRFLSQRDCDLHWFASCKSAANHCKSLQIRIAGYM